jgi:CheY-like chemotaxis protein
MEPASSNGIPGNVLIVEDDPLIALDFEDTVLGFGVKAVRTAGNVVKALEMIADQADDRIRVRPDFPKILQDVRQEWKELYV